MISGIPLPATDDPLEQPFWQGLAAGELRMQHCPACADWWFPPGRRCTRCGGQPRWQRVSGRGRIWSFVEVSPPVLPAFAPYAPYPVVLVELEEAVGLRLVGQVVCAPAAPINALRAQQLAIGAPVAASIEPLADNVYWPRWLLI
jgi:uncharacterized OB-fold protein